MTHTDAIKFVLEALTQASASMGFEPTTQAKQAIHECLTAYFPRPSMTAIDAETELRLRALRHFIELTIAELQSAAPDSSSTRNAILRLYYSERLKEVNAQLVRC
jgi:hypothetical protein